MSNTILEGPLDINVPAQPRYGRARRAMIKKAFNDGIDMPGEVRYGCAIALAVNAAISDGLPEVSFGPNPKVRAQFGRNKRDLPFLTVGLIDLDTGVPYTLTWEGATSIPFEMIEIAVKHDEGAPVPAVTISLELADARVHETGNKSGKGKKRDPRKNHDTDKSGRPYKRPQRRHHNRLCRADVKKIHDQMK